MIDESQLSSIRGTTVYDSDGDKIGKAGEVYLDDATGRPEWITVNTGLFGGHESFVPLEQATLAGDDLRVPFDKAKVKDAPRVAADGHLDPAEEEELYRYYGVAGNQGQDQGTGRDAAAGVAGTAGMAGVAGGQGDRDERGGREGLVDRAKDAVTDRDGDGVRDRDERGAAFSTGTEQTTGAVGGTSGVDVNDRGTRGRDTSGPTTDDAMTLSEEELRVGTQTREAGRARLRKYVVTEQQSVTVPVSREEVRLEREPITEANRGEAYDGPAISEEEHEVTLHEEVPVVSKEAHPVERVRATTQTVTDQQEVTDEVRKERVDLDEDGGTGRGTRR